MKGVKGQAWLRPRYESLARYVRTKHPEVERQLQQQRLVDTTSGYSLKPFDETRSIFIHIPKTAGVSVAKALYGNLAGGHNTVTDYLLAFGPEKFEEYFKFAFVRNPWDRLFSAFNFLRQGGFNNHDRKWAERHLRSYEDFGTFVDKGLRSRTVQSWIHFVPQHKFVCWSNPAELLVDYVGFFESLSPCMQEISEKLGRTFELGHKNRSREPVRDYKDAYDDWTRDIVADVYATDIEVFGYDFENTDVYRTGRLVYCGTGSAGSRGTIGGSD